MKDFQGACYAFEQFHVYSDSVTKMNNNAEIELVQSTFELEKSNAKINELELTAEKKKLQAELTWILIVGILSFLFVIGYALYKRNKYNIKLLRSIQVRDKLLSIIAHDLRSPINNVLMILLELENNQLSEEEKSTLFDALKKQTEMSLVTLENILSWGQFQLRNVNVNQEVFNLNEVIQNNISLVEVSLKNKEITVEADIDQNIELYTDMNQFDFVVRNLLSNAIKFSNYRSTILIKAETVNNNEIKLSIIDHGVGISDENLVLLFGVNQKVNVGTAKEKGSGLGLLLCKEFVEANHGEIGVKSKLNNGSTFYFTSKIAGKL
jgi:signal transduction histidine kinase